MLPVSGAAQLRAAGAMDGLPTSAQRDALLLAAQSVRRIERKPERSVES